MARPRLGRERHTAHRVTVRLSEAEYGALKHAARVNGISLTDEVVAVLRRHYGLDAPNEKLKELLARKPPWKA